MAITYIFIKDDDITRTKIENTGWDSSEAIPIYDNASVFTGWYILKLKDEFNDIYKDYCKFDSASASTNIGKAQNGTLLRTETYCPFLADNIVVYNDTPTVPLSTQTIDTSGYSNVTITYELISPTTTTVRVKATITDTNVDVNQTDVVLSATNPKAVISFPNFSGQLLKFDLSNITSSGDDVEIKIRGRW